MTVQPQSLVGTTCFQGVINRLLRQVQSGRVFGVPLARPLHQANQLFAEDVVPGALIQRAGQAMKMIAHGRTRRLISAVHEKGGGPQLYTNRTREVAVR